MDKKIKNALLDVAAEMIVFPITAYVTVKKAKDVFDESDTGKRVKAYAKQAGEELSSAAKKAAENEKVQNVKAKFDELSSKALERVKAYSDTASEKFEEFKAKSEDKMRDFADKAEARTDARAEEAEERLEEFVADTEERTEAAKDFIDGKAEEFADNTEARISKVQGDLDRIFDEVRERVGGEEEGSEE